MTVVDVPHVGYSINSLNPTTSFTPSVNTIPIHKTVSKSLPMRDFRTSSRLTGEVPQSRELQLLSSGWRALPRSTTLFQSRFQATKAAGKSQVGSNIPSLKVPDVQRTLLKTKNKGLGQPSTPSSEQNLCRHRPPK